MIDIIKVLEYPCGGDAETCDGRCGGPKTTYCVPVKEYNLVCDQLTQAKNELTVWNNSSVGLSKSLNEMLKQFEVPEFKDELAEYWLYNQ